MLATDHGRRPRPGRRVGPQRRDPGRLAVPSALQIDPATAVLPRCLLTPPTPRGRRSAGRVRDDRGCGWPPVFSFATHGDPATMLRSP